VNRKAFTLVELAIVVIIIGLLLGLVVKGKSLIQSAKMKKDFEEKVNRIYQDVSKYKLFSFEQKGYEGVIGDGIENGGFESTTNGFIDVDTDGKTVENLYSVGFSFSELRILFDYNGTETPYSSSSSLVHAFYSVDSEFSKIFNLANNFFSFTTSKGSVVKVFLGADVSGERQGNFVIFKGLNIEEAKTYDHLLDGEISGNSGKLILLGFRYSSPCSPNTTSTCYCSSGVCIGKGAEGGCDFPFCAETSVSDVTIGVKLDESY
jgi:prepilin-type N-terminal cleavage/methylation domain-containing protein